MITFFILNAHFIKLGTALGLRTCFLVYLGHQLFMTSCKKMTDMDALLALPH